MLKFINRNGSEWRVLPLEESGGDAERLEGLKFLPVPTLGITPALFEVQPHRCRGAGAGYGAE